jgi:integrase
VSPRPQAYRAKDGTITWHVRFRIDGAPNPVKETFGPFEDDFDGTIALAAAEKFAKLVESVGGTAARATRHRGEDSARTMPTLRTWFDMHLEHVDSYAAKGTSYGYRGEAERTWLPHLGGLPLDAITTDAVKKWVAWQREQETARSRKAREKARENGQPEPAKVLVKQKTIRNAHGLLSSVLQAAVDAEPQLITRNPAKGVRLPEDEQHGEMEILDQDEWARLYDAIPERWRPLTGFLLVIGCRIGEATAVMVKDVDLGAGTVRLRRAWKKGSNDSRYLGSTKTRRGVRTVRMGEWLTEALRPLVKGRSADELVFTAPAGGRVYAQHYRNRVWMAALERAGITKHITPHGLRHTSASWLLMANESPAVVQHRLGHESLATTSRVYQHLLTDAQIGAANVMDAASRPREIEG